MSKKVVSLSLDEELVDKLDETRYNISRSQAVNNILANELEDYMEESAYARKKLEELDELERDIAKIRRESKSRLGIPLEEYEEEKLGEDGEFEKERLEEFVDKIDAPTRWEDMGFDERQEAEVYTEKLKNLGIHENRARDFMRKAFEHVKEEFWQGEDRSAEVYYKDRDDWRSRGWR